MRCSTSVLVIGVGELGEFMRGTIRALATILLLVAPLQAFAQGKPVIAIYQMDDLARSGQAATLSTMIETAIAGTSKFRVIERERLNKLVGEQARAKAGLTTSNTPGKMGGFEGADFLIYGTITTLSVVQKADFASNLMGSMLGSNSNPQCTNTFATLGMDIKITDARSGEVRYVNRLNEVQKSSAMCGGSVAPVDSAALMRAAADKVATGLVMAIYPIQIAAVQADGVIVLNYGEGAVQPGAVLAVFAKGEVIRDPATGEVLANNEIKLGYIRVSDVVGRVSRADPLTAFSTPPPVGSIVRSVSPQEAAAAVKPAKRR